MDELNPTISKLRVLYERELEARRKLAMSTDSTSDDLQERILARYRDDVQWAIQLIHETLHEFQQFPPRHSRHFQKLEDFKEDGAYDQSIFVMTKFPVGDEDRDRNLQNVIEVTRRTIMESGYLARLAMDKHYHPILWDNVELYLLGCSKGVAIVEDRYAPELNPNVALEWGWMIAMGKDVLFLIEENFQHERADWSGFLNKRFNWEQPEKGIQDAIQSWLSE